MVCASYRSKAWVGDWEGFPPFESSRMSGLNSDAQKTDVEAELRLVAEIEHATKTGSPSTRMSTVPGCYRSRHPLRGDRQAHPCGRGKRAC
jgi:hypothetical protein